MKMIIWLTVLTALYFIDYTWFAGVVAVLVAKEAIIPFVARCVKESN